MSEGKGDPVQEGIPGQPYQDQEEGLPGIEQDLQGLPASGDLFGQGERETVHRDVLSGRVRTEHKKGGKPGGPLYEG